MELWPLFDLRLRTPRLELVLPDDPLCFALATVAAKGIHAPDAMPFLIPWTDAPSPELERGALQYWWRCRAEWSPTHWVANFAVLLDGEPIGSQGVQADDFGALRAVSTGSWLGREWQGRGLGREMRVAVLHLAFAGLGADWAFSGAHLTNIASQKVSEWVGYEHDGHGLDNFRNTPRWSHRYRLSRERWLQRSSEIGIEVNIEGLEGCREWFGFDSRSSSHAPT
jgi:RimJ/RimL family protein N-acetyltransferase